MVFLATSQGCCRLCPAKTVEVIKWRERTVAVPKACNVPKHSPLRPVVFLDDCGVAGYACVTAEHLANYILNYKDFEEWAAEVETQCLEKGTTDAHVR